MKQNESLNLIDEICKEKEITVNYLSMGWIRELKKNNQICHIVRNSFDLNSSGAYHIVNDKYATYEVLLHNNLPVIKHYIIFNPKAEGRCELAGNLEEEVAEIFSKIKEEKVVVKANTSSEGKNVYLVNSKKEAVEIIRNLFDQYFTSVSICPFENIECEYRATFLDGEILNIYKKVASGWKHNLANGAKIVLNLSKSEIEEVNNLALKAGKVVNARFVNIDISRKINGELFIMEINGDVCMSKFIEMAENGREIAKEIYSKAIDKMFE